MQLIFWKPSVSRISPYNHMAVLNLINCKSNESIFSLSHEWNLFCWFLRMMQQNEMITKLFFYIACKVQYQIHYDVSCLFHISICLTLTDYYPFTIHNFILLLLLPQPSLCSVNWNFMHNEEHMSMFQTRQTTILY